MREEAYLEITRVIQNSNRPAAGKGYPDHRTLSPTKGVVSSRDEEVQVLHGFDRVECARVHLDRAIFAKKMARRLPILRLCQSRL